MPLVTGFSAARKLSGFYEGTASFIDLWMEVLLYGLMGYQLYGQLEDIENFQAFEVVKVIFEGEKQSIKGIFSFFASPDYAQYSRYCLSIFALPLLWGLQESFSFARINRHETPDSFKKAIQMVRDFSLPENKRGFCSSLWKDTIRWIFPHYGIESAIDYLLYSLLLDGNLPVQDRKAALVVLIDFAKNVPGYAKIKGLETLEKIAHGISLKQFDIVEQNYGKVYKEVILTEKAWALDELQKYNPGFRKAGVKGFITNLYAYYLLWKMGDFGHPVSVVGLTLFKLGKLAITVNFMVTIGSQIAEFLYCPNPLKQGFNAAMQPTETYSTYNQECFDAYLSIFNKIPNQPSCTLVNLMPNFDLNASNFTLFNLSGAGVTGEQVTDLLMGLRQYQPDIHLTHFDLSNNAINTESGLTALFKAFQNISLSNPPSMPIQMLNLSNNNIGYTEDTSTVVLGTNLTYLPGLQTLDLSHNYIGLAADKGPLAIGESLKYLTDLQILDFSYNAIGVFGDNGTQVIGENFKYLSQLQTLGLSNNWIGFFSDEGTQAIGNGLQYLPGLQTLDLSNNRIGWVGDNGAQAIGNSLQYLTQLQTLDFSVNSIGYLSDEGTITIGENFKYLPQLQILDFSYNAIGSEGDNGTQALGENFKYLSQLQTLDLSNNYIGFTGDKGTQAIGESLQYLPQLQTLDLSNNGIGSEGGDSGTQAIGENLHYLFQLRNLDLSQNWIRSRFSNITHGILQLNNLKSLYVLQVTEVSLPPSQLTLLRQFWNYRNSNTDVYALITTQDVQDYLDALPNTTQVINLSRNFPDPSADLASLLFTGLSHFQNIQTLDLSNNGIGYTGANGTQAIGESLQYLTGLQTLDLSDNNIGRTGANGTIAIGNSFSSLTKLQTLDLSYNYYIVNNGTKALGKSLQYLTNLQTLDLSSDGIGFSEDGIEAIGESLKYLSQLRILGLSQNMIGEEGDNGTIAIGESLQYLTQLQTLDLSGNRIGWKGDTGTQTIGESLSYLPQLEILDLSNNKMGWVGDNGAQAIGEGLKYLSQIRTLDFSYNFISGLGAQSLLNSFPQVICNNLNLQTLNIQGNNFTNIPWGQTARALEGQYTGQIQQACEANRCFGTPVTPNQTAIQCSALMNSSNQFLPQDDCSIPIASAPSLSPSFMMSLFMMSQRSGAPLVLLSLWLLTLNLFADHP